MLAPSLLPPADSVLLSFAKISQKGPSRANGCHAGGAEPSITISYSSSGVRSVTCGWRSAQSHHIPYHCSYLLPDCVLEVPWNVALAVFIIHELWTGTSVTQHHAVLCPHTGKSRNPGVENVPQCKLTIPSVHHEEGIPVALEASV